MRRRSSYCCLLRDFLGFLPLRDLICQSNCAISDVHFSPCTVASFDLRSILELLGQLVFLLGARNGGVRLARPRWLGTRYTDRLCASTGTAFALS